MMFQLIVWFVMLTSCGRLSSDIRHVERGETAFLFGNEINTGKVVSLYVNGKKSYTCIVRWTIENTTITAHWMPDFRANYSKIFMDHMKNIWIADFDEHYEGTYFILGSRSAVVELIILACARNKYGPSCEYNCQCKEDNTVQCDSKTGHCLCKPGWQGIHCSEPCPISYYGENCSKACSCLNNGNCNHINGQCECQVGYKGDRCEDRCDEGTFGFNCQGKCNCQTGATCEPQSGNCVSTSNEKVIPKITQHNILDSTVVLECRVSSMSTGKFLWTLNGSQIENVSRHLQNDTVLSIKNLTVDDQYNLYKCMESGSGLYSDLYMIKISGPNSITFVAPNITMIQEHSALSLPCLTDCYPICSWKWTKFYPSWGGEKVISAENVLYFQNVSRQDAGRYSCTVQNKITYVSLEDFISLEIVYGPDELLFNLSNKIIELDERDSIAISCYADCFPPCQIEWTGSHAKSWMRSAELKLVNEKTDRNYTCRAMNPRKDNTTISDTIRVIVKSETGFHPTSTETTKEEDNKDSVFPSKLHLALIVLGMGAIVAVAVSLCLLRKSKICFRADIVSNTSRLIESKVNDGDENIQEVNLSGTYWTIVSNAEGEMNTAVETDFERHKELLLTGRDICPTDNESERSMRPENVKMNELLDRCFNPVQFDPVEIDKAIHPIQIDSVEPDEYIHPIHSDPVEPDPSVRLVHTEPDEYIHPIHLDTVEGDDFNNPTLSDALEPDLDRHPIQSNPVELAVDIHPIQSYHVEFDVDSHPNHSDEMELDPDIHPKNSDEMELEADIHPNHSDDVELDADSHQNHPDTENKMNTIHFAKIL